MNNEKYNQITDEAYENYYEYMRDDRQWEMSKEEFINKCKTDTEFSERWGLKIEERYLSWEERDFPEQQWNIYYNHFFYVCQPN